MYSVSIKFICNVFYVFDVVVINNEVIFLGIYNYWCNVFIKYVFDVFFIEFY